MNKRFLCDQANGDEFRVRADFPPGGGAVRVTIMAEAARGRAKTLDDARAIIGRYHLGFEVPTFGQSIAVQRDIADWIAATLQSTLTTMCQLNPEACAEIDARRPPKIPGD